jgi:hypothetical protein
MQNHLSNVQATTSPRNSSISWGSGDGVSDGTGASDTGGGPIQSDRVSNDYGGYSKYGRRNRPSGGKPKTPSHGSGSGSIIRAMQDKASANAFARFQNKKKEQTNHALNRLSNATDRLRKETNNNQKGQNTGFGGNDSYNDENPLYGGGGELYACLTCPPAQGGGSLLAIADASIPNSPLQQNSHTIIGVPLNNFNYISPTTGASMPTGAPSGQVMILGMNPATFPNRTFGINANGVNVFASPDVQFHQTDFSQVNSDATRFYFSFTRIGTSGTLQVVYGSIPQTLNGTNYVGQGWNNIIWPIP